MAIITIRGKIGSGAMEIGKLVSSKLHIDYIDREIIAEVASRLHMQEQEIVAKEMPPTSLQERIAEALARGYSIGDGIQGAYLPLWQIPLDDRRYMDTLTSFIKEISKHDVVIFGRGSQFILKDEPRAVHILIVAPFTLRIKRFMDENKLSEEQAKQKLIHLDNSMREFEKRFYNVHAEDPSYFHIVINTGHFNYEAAVSLILEAIRLRDPMATS
jgi:cytidylate kinase